MLVWLASYPRSGNTFFRVLLKTLCGLSTYDFHEPFPPRRDFENFIGEASLGTPLPELARDTGTHIVKTHEMPQEDYPAIYLVRDGRDAVVSYARFLLNSGYDAGGQDFTGLLRRLIESSESYGGWSGNVLAWRQRKTSTVMVRFDDLIANPIDELRRATAAAGLSLAETGLRGPPTFEELHKLDSKFFSKGRTGGWIDDMSPELHLLFWRRHGHAMRALGFHDQEPTAQELAGKPLQAGERLLFGIGQAGQVTLGAGWGEPEQWGVWSIQPQASLHVSVGPHHNAPIQIDLGYRSFIEGGRELEVTCLAEGRQLSSWTCRPATWRGVQRIVIPSNLSGAYGLLNLEFRISEPRSPAELGLSSDTRQLGIGLESMQLTGP
ncbi:sulfotransferase domain-containing protein [Bradyrhizobium sp. McL0616]|uniref:sulfotransferase domain-containing protein n=1 Tax=Bradyrhizobium sp. McL0616 TaxID=3415674 RepID=UPI003CF60289